MKCSLSISNFLEEISNLSHSVVFLYFFALILKKAFLFLLAVLWNSAFRCLYLSFFPLLLFLYLFHPLSTIKLPLLVFLNISVLYFNQVNFKLTWYYLGQGLLANKNSSNYSFQLSSALCQPCAELLSPQSLKWLSAVICVLISVLLMRTLNLLKLLLRCVRLQCSCSKPLQTSSAMYTCDGMLWIQIWPYVYINMSILIK